jgi:hypothetical protein
MENYKQSDLINLIIWLLTENRLLYITNRNLKNSEDYFNEEIERVQAENKRLRELLVVK